MPLHLAAESADPSLRMGSYQQAQCCLNHCLFRALPGAPHRLLHQLIIDFDIRPHQTLSCVRIAGLCVLSHITILAPADAFSGTGSCEKFDILRIVRASGLVLARS
jgi:hypothetical protein